MKVKFIIIISILLCLRSPDGHAFWVWEPRTHKLVNPKYAVKDSPKAQYNWAMKFYKAKDYSRASAEFIRLVEYYKDSELAPDAQYYAGRSFEAWGKYYRGYLEYQNVIDKYPFSKRIDEIIKRQFRIGNKFYAKRGSKIVGMELLDSLDKALEIYNRVIENAPYGEYADKSYFNIGQCHRRLQQYNEAIAAFQKIVDEYPKSPLARQARYQVARCTYLASLKPDYDQEPTDEAIEQYKKFALYGSDEKLRKEANEVLTQLEEKKAESAFKTAMFYERGKHYGSAKLYYKEIIENYSNTAYAELAKYRLELIEIRSKD